jgi:hypothetical protein
MSTPNDTPRTDANVQGGKAHQKVYAYFARTLERELAAKDARIADLEATLKAESWRADAMSEKELAASYDLRKMTARAEAAEAAFIQKDKRIIGAWSEASAMNPNSVHARIEKELNSALAITTTSTRDVIAELRAEVAKERNDAFVATTDLSLVNAQRDALIDKLNTALAIVQEFEREVPHLDRIELEKHLKAAVSGASTKGTWGQGISPEVTVSTKGTQ